MSIEYIDRKTNKVEFEQVYGHRALSFFYGDFWLTRLISFFLLPFLSKSPFCSRVYGSLQKSPASKKKVVPFIRTYGVDVSEFEKESFTSFNDFFIRTLKKSARPIEEDPLRAAMPADGRYLVFPDISKTPHFYVKGQSFDIFSFLQNEEAAKRYEGGSLAIIRLCPTDYHRFHFVADGTPLQARDIQGDLHSVNPIALRRRLSILWTNKRVMTDFKTDLFGTVQYVEVGAICVGTIHQTYQPNIPVKKGDEKGYFSFGGSCLVLLFEKGRILFDEDLVINSQKGFETKANFGQSLGRSCR